MCRGQFERSPSSPTFLQQGQPPPTYTTALPTTVEEGIALLEMLVANSTPTVKTVQLLLALASRVALVAAAAAPTSVAAATMVTIASAAATAAAAVVVDANPAVTAADNPASPRPSAPIPMRVPAPAAADVVASDFTPAPAASPDSS